MRNIKNETEWLKNNYTRFEVRVPKEDAEVFKQYLRDNNISFNEWCKNAIKKEIQK